MAKLVSKTYGDALFELAQEENKVDTLFEEVEALKTILSENPDFSKLMNHPKVDKEEKEAVAEAIFRNRMSDELTGFLKIIIANRRYADMIDVLDHFIARVKEYHRIGLAYVLTPLPLTDTQKASVERKLLESTDYETMEMNYSIDPSLIGGMVIRIGDKVVDSSVRSKLEKLTKELQSIQLARC